MQSLFKMSSNVSLWWIFQCILLTRETKEFNIEEMSQKFDVSAGLQMYFVVELTCNAISLLIRAFCSRHHDLKAVIKYF